MDFKEKNPGSNGDTSRGNVLKRLRNITCPYTGIRMINGSMMNRIIEKLNACGNLKEKLYLIQRYAACLQPVEHRIFDHFMYFVDSNPEAGLTECLSRRYPEHLTKLRLEEFKVIDSVDTKSSFLSSDTQLALRRVTAESRLRILENGNGGPFFKRKAFLSALESIQPKNPYEQRILSEIMNLALFLPTSGSSENAFVVKYSRRDEGDILRRLLIGSVATIEHVKPHSTGGKDSIGNFLLVSNNGNKYRENIPLSVYIDRNPGIPEYCQFHIEEIISAIHNGALKGNEGYPYKIKKTLFEESEGRILLDISSYCISEERAMQLEFESTRPRRSEQ